MLPRFTVELDTAPPSWLRRLCEQRPFGQSFPSYVERHGVRSDNDVAVLRADQAGREEQRRASGWQRLVTIVPRVRLGGTTDRSCSRTDGSDSDQCSYAVTHRRDT